MGIILKPFAWLLLFFYQVFQSYGLALILFAFVTKMLMFPVTLKSKKSMIQTTMLSGKMQQLQKQYGKDRERYNMEIQKLYEREKVNPMGGCVWSLIPMVVLIALYGIIREPMTYFMDLTVEQIRLIADQLNWQTAAVAHGWMSEDAMNRLVQQVADGKLEHIFQDGSFNQIYLLSLITPENLSSLQALVGESKLFVMDFSFLGLDLSMIPRWNFWTLRDNWWNAIGLFLLPLVSTGISYLSMKVSMATSRMNNKAQNDQMDKTNKMMLWMMPLMSLWIGFTLPAALCVYWIAQYIVTMVQEVVCGRLLKKDYEQARIAAEERERQEKEDEKRRKEEARLERARRAEEEKKNRGKKKPRKKEEEPDQEGVNKEDSREGLRAYARGRSYVPDRFGGVTPYTDPNVLIQAEAEAKAAKKGKKTAQKQEETVPAGQEEQETAALPSQEESAPEAPAEEDVPVSGEADVPEAEREPGTEEEEED